VLTANPSKAAITIVSTSPALSRSRVPLKGEDSAVGIAGV
jgi:hypothetical protein